MPSLFGAVTAAGHKAIGRLIEPQQRMRASQFEALPRPTADVVFLGDSITEYGLWNEWFPALSVANRGIGGDTSSGVLARMGTAIGTQRLVSLLIGTNDLAAGRTPEAIAATVAAIVGAVTQTAPASSILINSVMPRARSYRDRVVELNGLLSSLAAAQGAAFLDLWPILSDGDGAIRAEYSFDRLHLTGAGYAAWVGALRGQPILREG